MILSYFVSRTNTMFEAIACALRTVAFPVERDVPEPLLGLLKRLR